MRHSLKLLLLCCGLLAMSGAQANAKLDCLDDLLQLGMESRFNLVVVPQGPTVANDPSEDAAVTAELKRQRSIRKNLGIRVWVGYWNYDAGFFSKAQWAIAQYDAYLTALIDNGEVDPDAVGQPDLAGLFTPASACVNNLPEPLASGLQTMQSGGEERQYYLQLPADYESDPSKPLIIGLHGTGSSYLRWVGDNPAHDLAAEVGDGAIMVFPNALPDANGSPQWSFEYDFDFFLDLVSELELRGLKYNKNKLFVTGHSSGAGMTHEIGCRYGDIVRGIAPSAGSLLSTQCIGSTAVLMSQGTNDQLVLVSIASIARRYWSLYNGWEADQTVPGEISPCVDHSLLGSANTAYPVYWCEHGEGSLDDYSGHAWASFTSEAIWAFFSSLPEVEPTIEAPLNGGSERAQIPSDTTITFTLRYPADINRPLDGAISLFPADYINNPTFSIPSVFLSSLFQVGQPAPGDAVTYQVPIKFFVFSGPAVDFPSTWTLQFSVYVEGGTRPTPTAGVDHQALVLWTFDEENDPAGANEPIVIPGELLLVPADCFFNCD
jgi:polyhydroxybutyrate depolymerase